MCRATRRRWRGRLCWTSRCCRAVAACWSPRNQLRLVQWSCSSYDHDRFIRSLVRGVALTSPSPSQCQLYHSASCRRRWKHSRSQHLASLAILSLQRHRSYRTKRLQQQQQQQARRSHSARLVVQLLPRAPLQPPSPSQRARVELRQPPRTELPLHLDTRAPTPQWHVAQAVPVVSSIHPRRTAPTAPLALQRCSRAPRASLHEIDVQQPTVSRCNPSCRRAIQHLCRRLPRLPW